MAKGGDDKSAHVEDKSTLRRYRTEIPNIVEEMDLSVYAFRLYVRLKRVAGDGGKCFYTTRQLAEQCNMSVGAISKAKLELVNADLIMIERDGKWERDNITIVDMWPANFAYFADKPDKPNAIACSPHEQSQEKPCSPHEQTESTEVARSVHDMNAPVHHMNTSVHHVNAPVHVVNVKEEPYKEEPIKEEPEMNECSAPEPSPEPIHSFFHFDPDVAIDDTIDPERSYALLKDPEVGMDHAGAEYLSKNFGFEYLVLHVFAWIAGKGGDFGTNAALISRVQKGWNPRRLIEGDFDSDLFRRHFPDYERRKYTKPPPPQPKRASFRPPADIDPLPIYPSRGDRTTSPQEAP